MGGVLFLGVDLVLLGRREYKCTLLDGCRQPGQRTSSHPNKKITPSCFEGTFNSKHTGKLDEKMQYLGKKKGRLQETILGPSPVNSRHQKTLFSFFYVSSSTPITPRSAVGRQVFFSRGTSKTLKCLKMRLEWFGQNAKDA